MSPVAPHQRLPRYLSQAELEQFFQAITTLRDRLLFALIYHYGLRVGEVELLQRRDVNLGRDRILIRRLKGGYWSERPLFGATASLLREFLGANPAPDGAPLFSGRSGPLRKRQIQNLFRRYRDRAGLAGAYTCHGLRHSIATHLLDAGMNLEFVQDHLGHQSIRSTSIYARITDRHREALFEQLERSPWIVQPPCLAPAPQTTTVPQATAVSGFMATSPGRTLFAAGTSHCQPTRAAVPTTHANDPAIAGISRMDGASRPIRNRGTRPSHLASFRGRMGRHRTGIGHCGLKPEELERQAPDISRRGASQ